MALLAMASYCTPDNKRFDFTLRTLDSLARTVDWSRHRLVVIDNGSTCPEARRLFDSPRFRVNIYNAAPRDGKYVPQATLIRNAENRGQARALNQGWLLAGPGEVVARCDDDVAFLDAGWLDRLCDCLTRDPSLGIVGLKRPDAWERPDNLSDGGAWQSELVLLPGGPAQDWLVVEKAKSVMGTVQAWSPALHARVGYLYQGGYKWGLEDADAHCRATLAGFWCGFHHGPRIRHLDETPAGGSEYQTWKEAHARPHHPELDARRAAYAAGTLPLYRGPEDE